LLQGDYMALQFHLARAIEREELGTGNARGSAWRKEGAVGFVGVELDARRVATLAPQGAATAMHLRYRVRNGQVWLGTNAFFFAEGAAAHYSGARYGEFRIDAQSGEAVLVGLRDVNLQVL